MNTTRFDTYANRRDRLRAIWSEMQGSMSGPEAVTKIAELTGRKEWTVRMWMSNRRNGATIPADTLELLEIRLRVDLGHTQ